MKAKIAKPEDVKINDGIRAVDKNGVDLLDEPQMIGTNPIKLSRSHPIAAVNLLFPPGISRFYVERLNKNEIRFLVRTDEITRVAEKAEKMMKGSKGKPLSNEAEA
jgi:hypothetical protein